MKDFYDPTEYISLQKKAGKLYDKYFDMDNKHLPKDDKEILKSLEEIRNRYVFLMEEVYDFENLNDINFILIVNVLHTGISKELNIHCEENPFYDKSDFDRKKNTVFYDEKDYTNGKFDNLIRFIRTIYDWNE